MGLFVVTTTIPTREGNVWYGLEVPGVETIDEFDARIVERGTIVGYRYFKRKRGAPGYDLHDHILGLNGILTVQIAGDQMRRDMQGGVVEDLTEHQVARPRLRSRAPASASA